MKWGGGAQQKDREAGDTMHAGDHCLSLTNKGTGYRI